jgi:hypothetical protein
MDQMTYFYITLGLMLASLGIGYYIGERGMAGVKIDLDNTKNEIEKVKNLVASKTIPQAVTVVAPVSGSATTPATTVSPTPRI